MTRVVETIPYEYRVSFCGCPGCCPGEHSSFQRMEAPTQNLKALNIDVLGFLEESEEVFRRTESVTCPCALTLCM